MRVECFISYARDDVEVAKEIISVLRKEHINAWWDDRVSPGTNDFTGQIEKAIDASQCFLVIWTPKSIDSPWVKSEALRAFTQRKNKVLSLSQ